MISPAVLARSVAINRGVSSSARTDRGHAATPRGAVGFVQTLISTAIAKFDAIVNGTPLVLDVKDTRSNMNRTISIIATLALTLGVAACKKKEGDGSASGSKTAEAKGPTMALNEADWVAKDLNTVAPLIHVTMKVPKDAKLEKNGNGGVDVHVSDFYMLTVSAIAASNVKETMESDKSLTIKNTSYINGKVISEEPNGFVYSMQMKDEANGTKYQPEAHFAVYLEKDGAIYSILDQKPMDAFSTPGSAYSEDIAKKVYAIVKGSAKIN
jgi:hypothetical protein